MFPQFGGHVPGYWTFAWGPSPLEICLGRCQHCSLLTELWGMKPKYVILLNLILLGTVKAKNLNTL